MSKNESLPAAVDSRQPSDSRPLLNNIDMRDAADLSHVGAKAELDSFIGLAAGRKVRILSNYNGQPFGGSRPSQKGRICTVKRASWSLYHGWSLQLEEFAYGHPFIALDQVEFVLPQETSADVSPQANSEVSGVHVD